MPTILARPPRTGLATCLLLTLLISCSSPAPPAATELTPTPSKSLDDSPPAINSTGGSSPDSARHYLERMATVGPAERQSLLREVISRSDQLVPELASLLQTETDPKFRLSAVKLLGHLGANNPAVVPVLTEVLSDDDFMLKREAADGLGKLGPAAKDAVPALTAALNDKESFVVSRAAAALGEIGPAAAPATPALLKLLEGTDPHLQQIAVAALVKIGPAEAVVPVLVKLLKQADPLQQREIVVALGNFGPAAVAAIPAIKTVQNETFVKRAAEVALGKIQPDSDPASSLPSEGLEMQDDPTDRDKPADPDQVLPRVKQFHAALQAKDLPTVRAMLTNQARPNFGEDGINLQIAPDSTITYGKPRFKDQLAAVPVTLQTASGEIEKSHVMLRGEFGQWRVYGVRLPQADGKPVLIDLENPDSFFEGFAPEFFPPTGSNPPPQPATGDSPSHN